MSASASLSPTGMKPERRHSATFAVVKPSDAMRSALSTNRHNGWAFAGRRSAMYAGIPYIGSTDASSAPYPLPFG